MGKLVRIWTDGSCLGNPGPGGWGALLTFGDHERELAGGEDQTTNNRMELQAAIEALETLKRPCEIELWSDSKYVIEGITNWIKGWRRRNWKKVKNRDLWERLDEARARHDVEWRWVKGHSGDENNDRVDRLAVAQAEQRRDNS
ncbi:MAG: ribonuclease HI [Planctomycetes bacterium]|nr:ribonuclease HI [Planctomycetota bacterium]